MIGTRLFKRCVDCKKPMVTLERGSGREIPAASAWPWCMGCFNKRARDPEFGAWVRKVLGMQIKR
jgi:hypothetical protein